MGRKNKNVRRSKDRKRYARRATEQGLGPPVSSGPRERLERLVMPDGQCTSFGRRPKARFATEAKAAEALRQAQKKRANVASGHVEKRYYPCPEGGCGGYHLTSRETFDETTWQSRRRNAS